MEDIVAQYPKDISDYLKTNGKLPDDFNCDPGFVCAINGQRYFIHTRATLPLHAFDKGVGFGMWVEVERTVFFDYMKAVDDDNLYKDVKFEGKLANEWPGFVGMKGARVLVRTVKMEDKVHITEVYDINDVLFEVAVRTQSDEDAQIQHFKELVEAYVKDPEYNQPPSNDPVLKNGEN